MNSLCPCFRLIPNPCGRWIIVPPITETVSGLSAISYDRQQSISLMPDLQIFIWATLIWLTPGLGLLKKGVYACIGAIVGLGIFAGFVSLNEIFKLTPHVGLVKLGVVLLPFVIYLSCILEKSQPAASPKK